MENLRAAGTCRLGGGRFTFVRYKHNPRRAGVGRMDVRRQYHSRVGTDRQRYMVPSSNVPRNIDGALNGRGLSHRQCRINGRAKQCPIARQRLWLLGLVE